MLRAALGRHFLFRELEADKWPRSRARCSSGASRPRRS